MFMQRENFNLDKKSIDYLNDRKQFHGVPKSETVRRALDLYMQKNPVKK